MLVPVKAIEPDRAATAPAALGRCLHVHRLSIGCIESDRCRFREQSERTESLLALGPSGPLSPVTRASTPGQATERGARPLSPGRKARRCQ